MNISKQSNSSHRTAKRRFGIIFHLALAGFTSLNAFAMMENKGGSLNWALEHHSSAISLVEKVRYKEAAEKYYLAYALTQNTKCLDGYENFIRLSYKTGGEALMRGDFKLAYRFLNDLEHSYETQFGLYKTIIKPLVRTYRRQGAQTFADYILWVADKGKISQAFKLLELFCGCGFNATNLLSNAEKVINSEKKLRYAEILIQITEEASARVGDWEERVEKLIQERDKIRKALDRINRLFNEIVSQTRDSLNRRVITTNKPLNTCPTIIPPNTPVRVFEMPSAKDGASDPLAKEQRLENQ